MAIHGQTGGDVPLLKELGEDTFWHLTEPGWEDKNYAAFTANYDRYIPGHVKGSVPPEIAAVIETGMSELFSQYCQNAIDWEDKLNSIETECNALWETLS